MEQYQIITLVDITNNGTNDQRANFNSLIQAIGLRSIIAWEVDPEFFTGSLPSPIEGKANHWIWEFTPDRELVFLKDDNLIGFLLDDIHGVPVITQLDDTADIHPAAFQTKGAKVNTWIYAR